MIQRQRSQLFAHTTHLSFLCDQRQAAMYRRSGAGRVTIEAARYFIERAWIVA